MTTVELSSKIIFQKYLFRFRKKSGGLVDTLGKMVGKQDYDSYTELELHAELVYAECLLLKAMLTVCEDETLVSFVKAGLQVRRCYLSFRSDFRHPCQSQQMHHLKTFLWQCHDNWVRPTLDKDCKNT